MRSIETSFVFPLSAVKPLEGLLTYRQFCVDTVLSAERSGAEQREICPACQSSSTDWATIEGLGYARCVQCSSLFLRRVPLAWGKVLSSVSHRRNSQEAIHARIVKSRTENVYEPRLDWIHNTLLFHGLTSPRVLEVTTAPSPYTNLMKGSMLFVEITTIEESELLSNALIHQASIPAEAAVLLESLDRSQNPATLLERVGERLASGGLLFVTALVCSGFDMVVLGAENRYLYPPDRANCFSLDGLEKLLVRTGYSLVELSTPGVLDVEIVVAHKIHVPNLRLSAFEQQLLASNEDTRAAFQSFLQQSRLSSFARIVARKVS